MIFEIAQSQKEAESLARKGFGYESRKEAEKALADPKIDGYYRVRLKVFAIPETAPTLTSPLSPLVSP